MVAVSSLLALAAASAADARPNIVIVFADDYGYGDASFNGNPTIHTPNLDRLVAEGMRFTQWHSAFHICSPSRAAMLTGRLPVRSGCAGTTWQGGVFTDDAVGGLPQNETTFADVLGARGYASMAVGKWHLGQQPQFLPTSHGFDEYFGIPYSVDMGRSAWDKPFGADRVSVLPLLHNTTVLEQPVDLATLDERYAARAVDFVRRCAIAGRPFVLYFACNHVHVPDYASTRFCNTSRRGRFGDAVAEMDRSVGTLMAGVKQAGIDENTVLFFTSDNGPWLTMRTAGGSAGPFFEGKGTTWEGGIRMPAFARWPGRVPAMSVSAELVATYDIFATAAALAGAEVPADRIIDGRDISGVMLRGEASPHECLFHYKGVPSMGFPPRPDDPYPGLWAVRCGAYKAHYVTACSMMHQLGDRRCSQSPAPDAEHVDSDPEYYGRASAPIVHSPPVLYNVEHDLGEMYPIPPSSSEYRRAMDVIGAAKRQHEATLAPVPNQMGAGADERARVCCDPDSQGRFPGYPSCTCNPENFEGAFVCAPVYPRTAQSAPPELNI